MTTTVPFVQKSDTLHEILLKVSEGRLGLACVEALPALKESLLTEIYDAP